MNGNFQMPPGMDMQQMFNGFMQQFMQQQQQNNQERGLVLSDRSLFKMR